MPNLTHAKSPKKTKNTECRRLRLEYSEEHDAMSIMHLDIDGNLLSECCLELEEAYGYAQSIIAVFDEALGIE